jgi:hypothetical protein
VTDKTRSARRIRLEGHIVGEVTVFQPMTILDVSELGLMIESPTPLQNDSLHDFRVPLGELHVVLKGRVVYCHVLHLEEGAVTYRCGIEFTEPPEHALAAIRAFLEARDTGGAPPRIVDGELAE